MDTATESVAANWKVDKSKYPPGPWMEEPDRVEFRHVGLPCLLVRQASHGAWCGYVGVPPGHPLHGLDYGNEKVNVSVHGGLTFAAACHPKSPVCHVPLPGEPAEVWWFGFDCVHSGDYAPGHDRAHYGPYGGWPGEQYRTQRYVEAEVKRLAEQLAKEAA